MSTSPLFRFSSNRHTGCGAYLLIFLLFASCSAPVGEHHPEWKKYFDEYGVTGCIEIYDLKQSRFIDYNPERCGQRFIPASTFKIPNALIALHSGLVADTALVMKWDSVDRGNPKWNRDQSMGEAFRNSTVWYFQEIAKEIGQEKYAYYLKLLNYGNKNPGGAVDSFWLNGDLRISADEQVGFLIALRTYDLRVSDSAMRALRGMMLLEKNETYSLYGKTGWARNEGLDLGWFVGWVEKGDQAYFFAMNCEAPLHAAKNFGEARKAIVRKCLGASGVIP